MCADLDGHREVLAGVVGDEISPTDGQARSDLLSQVHLRPAVERVAGAADVVSVAERKTAAGGQRPRHDGIDVIEERYAGADAEGAAERVDVEGSEGGCHVDVGQDVYAADGGIKSSGEDAGAGP